jgi:hypothetical protein
MVAGAQVTGATARIGVPVELFSALGTNGGSIAADGQRVLLSSSQGQLSTGQLTLVVNCTEGLSGR